MKIIFVILAFFSWHINGFSQSHKIDKSIIIDSILTECNQHGIFNGVALIADKGDIILSKSYGVADYKTKEKLSTSTRFYIGALTQQFTAALIFKLYQTKKINIHLPIGDYLPEFKNKKYKYITVYHLLTHTSGLTAFEKVNGFNKSEYYSQSDLFEMIKSKDLDFKAGSKFELSNSNYYLLGKILEKLSRKSFHNLLNDEILKPLKMTHSGYDTTWLKNNVAHGFYKTVDGNEKFPEYALTSLFSAGGMYSTATDLFKWDQALYKNSVLKAKMRKIMFQPFVDEFACAWRVDKGKDDDSVYFERHQMGGMKSGFNTYMMRLIPQKQTIILLDNFYNPEILDIKNSIWAVLENRQGWVPRPMLSTLLYKKIIQGRLPQTVAWLEQNREDYEQLYVFEEYDINQVGYKLFRLGRLDEARQIFEFNIALFPNAWNVYDSYAELLLELGEIEKSKIMYQKSLDLNPDNENAQYKIEQINEMKY